MNIDFNKLQNNTDTPDDELKDILRDAFKGAFVKIFVDGQHVATMLTDDYFDYKKEMKETPEQAAERLIKQHSKDGSIQSGLSEISKGHPDSDVEDALGYMITRELYDKDLEKAPAE